MTGQNFFITGGVLNYVVRRHTASGVKSKPHPPRLPFYGDDMEKSIIEKLGITQGPWRYENRWADNLFGRVVLCEGRDFGRGSLTINVSHDQERESLNANGQLIAAAPEMLEALIELIDSNENGGRMYRGEDARSEGKRIIQKATGKTWEEIKEIL